jgi:hypothetical protein
VGDDYKGELRFLIPWPWPKKPFLGPNYISNVIYPLDLI